MKWEHEAQPRPLWSVSLTNHTKLIITWYGLDGLPNRGYWRMDLACVGASRFHTMCEFHHLGERQVKEVQREALMRAMDTLLTVGKAVMESQYVATNLLAESFRKEEEDAREEMDTGPA